MSTSNPVPRILFNVGNGIGLGHQVRCVNIASGIRKSLPNSRILFITQSYDISALQQRGFSYVRSPVLWKLSNFDEKAAYLDLLTDVIDTFKPHIYLQDGIATDYFFQSQVLNGSKKILIITRYSEDRFKELFGLQRFLSADLVLIPQFRKDFFLSVYSEKFRKHIFSRDKIFFSGPITRFATEKQISTIRTKYRLTDKTPVILFVAGGGGQHDHIDSQDSDSFFQMAAMACRVVAEMKLSVQLIIVKGPYSLNDLEFSDAIVTNYEPALPALIGVSSCVVLRPGYNTLYETLFAKKPSIIVPTTVTREEQTSLANYLQRAGLAHVVPLGDSRRLSSLIVELIQNPDKLYEMKATFKNMRWQAGNSKAVEKILQLLPNDIR